MEKNFYPHEIYRLVDALRGLIIYTESAVFEFSSKEMNE